MVALNKIFILCSSFLQTEKTEQFWVMKHRSRLPNIHSFFFLEVAYLIIIIFTAPTSKKLRAYCFGLVRLRVMLLVLVKLEKCLC